MEALFVVNRHFGRLLCAFGLQSAPGQRSRFETKSMSYYGAELDETWYPPSQIAPTIYLKQQYTKTHVVSFHFITCRVISNEDNIFLEKSKFHVYWGGWRSTCIVLYDQYYGLHYSCIGYSQHVWGWCGKRSPIIIVFMVMCGGAEKRAKEGTSKYYQQKQTILGALHHRRLLLYLTDNNTPRPMRSYGILLLVVSFQLMTTFSAKNRNFTSIEVAKEVHVLPSTMNAMVDTTHV